jgi:hypothetical protein
MMRKSWKERALSTSAQCDFVIDQNADFIAEIYWTDYNNIPIYVIEPIRMEIRSKTGQLEAELIYDGSTPVGQTPSAITYNSDSGLIQIHMPADQTNAMHPGLFNYDLFVTYSDAQNNATLRRHRMLYGQVEVRGKVTRNV